MPLKVVPNSLKAVHACLHKNVGFSEDLTAYLLAFFYFQKVGLNHFHKIAKFKKRSLKET